MTPQYIQWTIPSLLYQTRSKNPLVHNGLIYFQHVISETTDMTKKERSRTPSPEPETVDEEGTVVVALH